VLASSGEIGARKLADLFITGDKAVETLSGTAAGGRFKTPFGEGASIGIQRAIQPWVTLAARMDFLLHRCAQHSVKFIRWFRANFEEVLRGD
jgi:hypothetical protein